jgi:hypothetical protein
VKPLTDKEYVAKDGGACPNCRGGDVTSSDQRIDGPGGHTDCECATCGATWTDHYTLVGYSNLVVNGKVVS